VSQPKTYWEHFSHVADVGVRGFGATLADSFEQAALAMMAVIAELKTVSPDEVVDIHCQAPDIELLLVDWLNAIVFEMATRKMLFGEFHVRIDGTVLEGRALGEKINVSRHSPSAEIKGATFSELEVARAADGVWHAQCVVDV